MSQAEQTPQKSTWLLTALAVLVSLPMLSAGFVLDDHYLIVANETLASGDWQRMLFSDLWSVDPEQPEGASFFRPLFALSLLLDHALFGTNPMGYHLQSLLWRVLAVVLTARLVGRLIGSRYELLGGAVALLHPLALEPAAWVSARNDLMALCLGLGALLFARRDRPSSAGIAVLTLLAMLSKESVVLLPLWLWVASDRTHRVKNALAATGGVAAAFLLRLLAGVSVPASLSTPTRIPDLALTALDAAGRLALPWPLSPMRELGTFDLTFGCIGLTCLVLGLWILIKGEKAPKLAWALLLTAPLPAVPALLKYGFHGDRYLLWSVVGLALVVPLLSRRIWLPTLCLWGGLSLIKIPDWSSEMNLWSGLHRDQPTALTALSLAITLDNAGETTAAVERYREAYAHDEPRIARCPRFVFGVLQVAGPEVALAEGAWAVERGCPLSGELRGVLAIAAWTSGELNTVMDLCTDAPVDPTERLDAVQMALWTINGELDKVAGRRAELRNAAAVEAQVERLLETWLDLE